MEGWWQISWQKPCRKEDTGSNIFKAMKEANIANLEPCSLQKGRLLHGHYFCLNGQLSQLYFREISIIKTVYYLNISSVLPFALAIPSAPALSPNTSSSVGLPKGFPTTWSPLHPIIQPPFAACPIHIGNCLLLWQLVYLTWLSFFNCLCPCAYSSA